MIIPQYTLNASASEHALQEVRCFDPQLLKDVFAQRRQAGITQQQDKIPQQSLHVIHSVDDVNAAVSGLQSDHNSLPNRSQGKTSQLAGAL
jgi:hypothetical protein